MPGSNGFDVAKLVEPDRVHRTCYTDDEIFERELAQIFHKSWIYVGHVSQMKQVGDYCTTQIGSQPSANSPVSSRFLGPKLAR